MRVIGQRQELSFYDVKLANKAYCSSESPRACFISMPPPIVVGGEHNVLGSSVRPSVRPSVDRLHLFRVARFLFIYWIDFNKTWHKYLSCEFKLLKRCTRSWVKVQGHTLRRPWKSYKLEALPESVRSAETLA